MKTFVTYCTRDYILHALTSLESALSLHAEASARLICVDSIHDLPILPVELWRKVKLSNLDEYPVTRLQYSNFLRSRSKFESLISIKPQLLFELCKSLPENEMVIYQDTDVIFFSEMDTYPGFSSKHSVYIFEHQYRLKKDFYPHGKYNAGFLVLKNNSSSQTFLEEWSSKCHEWCYLRVENGKYADQKYLEELSRYSYVSAENSKQINLGMHFFDGGSNLKSTKKRVLLDNRELICFHFHGFKVHKRVTESGLNRYGFSLRNFNKFKNLYIPTINRYFSIKRILEYQIGLSLLNSIQLQTDVPIEYSQLTFLKKLKSCITGTYLINSLLKKHHLVWKNQL